MLARVRSQSHDLGRALSLARQDPALQARLIAATAQLSGVTDALSHALAAPSFPMHAADLTAIERAMQANDAGTLLTEVVAAQAGAAAVLAARVAATSASTRHEVQTLSHDLFERHIFDSYLHFGSPADEAGFREREAEAKRSIAAQLAKGTPEGNLNAGGGELSYMLDAHAHGAGNSLDFLPRWNALLDTTRRQHAAMRAAGQSTAEAAGQSTAEYDRIVNTGARRLLKAETHLRPTPPTASLPRNLPPKLVRISRPDLPGSASCVPPLMKETACPISPPFSPCSVLAVWNPHR